MCVLAAIQFITTARTPRMCKAKNNNNNNNTCTCRSGQPTLLGQCTFRFISDISTIIYSRHRLYKLSNVYGIHHLSCDGSTSSSIHAFKWPPSSIYTMSYLRHQISAPSILQALAKSFKNCDISSTSASVLSAIISTSSFRN